MIELSPEGLMISVAGLWAIYKAVCWLLDRYNVGNKRKEYKLMKDANKNLMREVIRMAHKEYMALGYIDEDELEHLEGVYEIYHGLNGNGTGDRWMEELRSLPRK